MQVYLSCCNTTNCIACEDASLSSSERQACYSAGCCCFGAMCTTAECCSGDERSAKGCVWLRGFKPDCRTAFHVADRLFDLRP